MYNISFNCKGHHGGTKGAMSVPLCTLCILCEHCGLIFVYFSTTITF